MACNGDFDVIIHGCNCFCNMGAGIAKQIKREFPEAYKADLQTKKGDKKKLGTFSFAECIRNGNKIIVVNGYTQYNYGRNKQNADYDAIETVMMCVWVDYGKKNLRIGYPKIGAGLAGGNWEIISEIIEDELEGEDHTLVEYER